MYIHTTCWCKDVPLWLDSHKTFCNRIRGDLYGISTLRYHQQRHYSVKASSWKGKRLRNYLASWSYYSVETVIISLVFYFLCWVELSNTTFCYLLWSTEKTQAVLNPSSIVTHSQAVVFIKALAVFTVISPALCSSIFEVLPYLLTCTGTVLSTHVHLTFLVCLVLNLTFQFTANSGPDPTWITWLHFPQDGNWCNTGFFYIFYYLFPKEHFQTLFS